MTRTLFFRFFILVVLLTALGLFSVGASRGYRFATTDKIRPNAGASPARLSQQNPRTPAIDENQIPIVDYNAPETLDPSEREKRSAKGKRYNDRDLKDTPSLATVFTGQWLVQLPALPVNISDAIVIGEVLNAEAFMSQDKGAVYSEFAVHVEETLKDNGHIALGEVLATEREGGRIRFPSGRIRTVVTDNQGVPLVKHRYLFFLKRNDDEPNVLILTAYELGQGTVSPLDGRAIQNGQLLGQFAKYDGSKVGPFLEEVRSAIAANAQQTPKMPQ